MFKTNLHTNQQNLRFNGVANPGGRTSILEQNFLDKASEMYKIKICPLPGLRLEFENAWHKNPRFGSVGFLRKPLQVRPLPQEDTF
jgi:hypothetical protein